MSGRPRKINRDEVYEMYCEFARENVFMKSGAITRLMSTYYNCSEFYLLSIVRKFDKKVLEIPEKYKNLFE